MYFENLRRTFFKQVRKVDIEHMHNVEHMTCPQLSNLVG